MSNTKTLLLCFVHGFRGGDWTFDGFPRHLAELIHKERPELEVETAVYPKYETRGELPSCVASFRQWLLDKVLTMEKAAGNTSPKTKPTVGTILIGHSMGGFVASDALLSILNDTPTTYTPPKANAPPQAPTTMFPVVHGILTFDTPFCGLSRSMFAYGAVSSYQGYSSATSLFSLLAMRMGPGAALFTIGSFAYKNREALQKGMGSLTSMKWDDWTKWRSQAESESENGEGDDKDKNGGKMSWENVQEGLAYLSKENLGEGMAYITSHLEFVGVLFRGVELQERLERIGELRGVGFADLYATLGTNSFYSGGYFIPERTFIATPTPPTSSLSRFFIKEPNLTPSTDEISAHLNMFSPAQNTSYEEMSLHAKGLIVSWALNNRGVVVDDWKTRAVEREDKWKDLSRYTIDPESGEVKEWAVAVKEKEARESYWNYANYAPDVGKIRGYIPAVPGMRGVSGASEGGDGDGKGFDEAVAKTAQDGVNKKQGDGAQATSFWSRYMPSSVAGAPKQQAATEQSEESKESKESKENNDSTTKAEAAAPSFTSYLWSADTGLSSSDDKAKATTGDAAASQSWLSYGYSYIPNVRAGSNSRPGTPAPKKESESKVKPDDAQKVGTETEEAQKVETEERQQKEAAEEANSSIAMTSEGEKKGTN